MNTEHYVYRMAKEVVDIKHTIKDVLDFVYNRDFGREDGWYCGYKKRVRLVSDLNLFNNYDYDLTKIKVYRHKDEYLQITDSDKDLCIEVSSCISENMRGNMYSLVIIDESLIDKLEDWQYTRICTFIRDDKSEIIIARFGN